MSNKELLKLENEFKDELPKYKEKPKIGVIEKPSVLTSRVSAFLERATKEGADAKPERGSGAQGDQKDRKHCDKMVEMDVYITPSSDD